MILFENRLYTVVPSLRLVREIEEELGGIPALVTRFAAGTWTVTELVTLIHMMLHAAGKTVDWAVLGDVILKEGTAAYLRAARMFLDVAMNAA